MIEIPIELFDDWWNSMCFIESDEEDDVIAAEEEPVNELDAAISLAEFLQEEKVAEYLKSLKGYTK